MRRRGGETGIGSGGVGPMQENILADHGEEEHMACDGHSPRAAEFPTSHVSDLL